MKNPMLLFSLLAVAVALALTACTKKQTPSVSEMTPAQLTERGRAIYTANCLSCHNVDPSKDGSVGPAIAGASAELLEARVLKAEYPKAYHPKRDTHVMPAMPYLQAEVPALAAYLSSLGAAAK